MAYIETDEDIASVHDMIKVLFLQEHNGEILARNCLVDTIYIKAEDCEDHYIGKYCAIDLCGDDSLLQYRRYKEEVYQEGALPLQFQTMMDDKQKNIFYRGNHFMDIKTVSDDDDFLKRIQLPF